MRVRVILIVGIIFGVVALVEAEPFSADSRSAAAAETESAPVVAAPPSFSLNVDGDIDLGGAIFKNAVPFIHEDGGPSSRNTGTGRDALVSTTPGIPTANDGIFNSALGFQALKNNTTGSANTGLGESALFANTSGIANTAVGSGALYSNSFGDGNTSTGYASLVNNTYGYFNTATGFFALAASTQGSYNTADGHLALVSNTTGDWNTAVGSQALRYSDEGHKNTAVGYNAAAWMYDGSRNTAVGTRAGYYWSTGDDNIAIGSGSNGSSGDSGTIRIGGFDFQNATYIEGISSTGVSGVQVMITSDDQLGIAVSSARFKQDIRDLQNVSDRLQLLRPVSFRYKGDLDSDPAPEDLRYGLIAEEVSAVFPELVADDAEGRPFTVRYDQLSPLLLGEVQQQKVEIDDLRSQIQDLRKIIADLRRTTTPQRDPK